MPQPQPRPGEVEQPDSHELPRVFAEHGLALNDTLVGMLNEHFSHLTERRGCGFTQATRHLAVHVNKPRERDREVISQLFPRWSRAHLAARDGAGQLASGGEPLLELDASGTAIDSLRQALRAVIGSLERE